MTVSDVTPTAGDFVAGNGLDEEAFGACYLRSDGTSKPGRVHFRSPSYVNLASMPQMTKGGFLADVVAVIGSIDIVLGDIDR